MRSATIQRRRAERAGRLAEGGTAVLLICKGYRILGRRLRTPKGEIDLVIRRGRAIAFVEVKLRPSRDGGIAAVTLPNRQRIVAAAEWWLAANPAYVRYDMRFDIVVWTPWGWPRHIPAAFDAEA